MKIDIFINVWRITRLIHRYMIAFARCWAISFMQGENI